MKLVASLVTHNEMGRYLQPCVRSLLGFCDEIAVLDDRSDDGTAEWLGSLERVRMMTNPGAPMFEHEGYARQRLLDWTVEAKPSHVLAIDADEFVADGQKVRMAIDRYPHVQAFTLSMQEIWKACPDTLCVRTDGGWRVHDVPILFAVPPNPLRDQSFRMSPKQLACGREPMSVRNLTVRGKSVPSGTAVLHFGWAEEADRQRRYDRYVVADGGRFHASSHLQSIMWLDDQVDMEPCAWPEWMDRDEILGITG